MKFRYVVDFVLVPLLIATTTATATASNLPALPPPPTNPARTMSPGITLRPAPHAARAWPSSRGLESASALLGGSAPQHSQQSKRVLQSSFPRNFFNDTHIAASSNGFVYACFHAYSSHHHLVLRPEDIWFAILSQLSFYVNAHAEQLRAYFVAHEGQKELEVEDVGDIHSVDIGLLAQRMALLIQEHVKDERLREWMMPNWTTTREGDRAVASVLMMGTMQKYFSYRMSLLCGIPSVTLLGSRQDWADILKRLDKLQVFGEEPALFATLLRPVLGYFIRSFDQEPGDAVNEFWGKIVHKTSGSGPYHLSGWITAFCFWDEEGKLLYHRYGADGPQLPVSLRSFEARNAGCDLDGVLYHRVNTDDIPSGFASVPVVVDDNGKIYRTKMVAGSLGLQVTSSGEMLDDARNHADSNAFTRRDGKMVPREYVPKAPTKPPGSDTLQPLPGWIMYEVKEVVEPAQAGVGFHDEL